MASCGRRPTWCAAAGWRRRPRWRSRKPTSPGSMSLRLCGCVASQAISPGSSPRLEALRRHHDTFRALLQINLTVLATAHAVSEGIVRGVSGEMARHAAPQTYGASGPRQPRPHCALPACRSGRAHCTGASLHSDPFFVSEILARLPRARRSHVRAASVATVMVNAELFFVVNEFISKMAVTIMPSIYAIPTR